MDGSRFIPAPLSPNRTKSRLLMSSSAGWTGRWEKKSGLQPLIPQPAYQQAWLWSGLPNLQRNHHHLKPSWWTELLGTNRQSWLAVFALRLHASANSKYSEWLFCSYFQHGWSFCPPEWTCLRQHRGVKVQTHGTTEPLKFPSNVIWKGALALIFSTRLGGKQELTTHSTPQARCRKCSMLFIAHSPWDTNRVFPELDFIFCLFFSPHLSLSNWLVLFYCSIFGCYGNIDWDCIQCGTQTAECGILNLCIYNIRSAD